jgi:hypothetical protein
MPRYCGIRENPAVPVFRIFKMTMYQIIAIVLFAIKCTIHAIKHGEPSGKYNFWGAAINTGIWVWLLIGGGFF